MSKLSFISFCVEHYAQHTHKSSDEVYKLFTGAGDLLRNEFKLSSRIMRREILENAV